MRSTIFTSVLAALAACSIPAPSPAAGDSKGDDAAPRACYLAVYSPAYMDSHPDHPVTRITLLQTGSTGSFEIGVVTSTRGPAARQGKGGQWFRDQLTCDGAICRSRCGGQAHLEVGPDGATLTTDHLLIGQAGSCEQTFDLAVSGKLTLRLEAVHVSKCTGI